MVRNKNTKNLILILILFIGVGFALISSNLGIVGIGNFRNNSWEIYFDNLVDSSLNTTLLEPATISNDKTTIEFNVNLNEPGANYMFYTDIVNNGTIDAMIDSIEIEGLTEEASKYVIVKIIYSDGIKLNKYDLLKAESKDTLKVEAYYTEDIEPEELPAESGSINLTITINYEQADSNAKERNHITVVNRQETGKLQTGDEIAIGTEHFYVVSTDKDKTVLLAKYNLNIDEKIQSTQSTKVAFSGSRYWAYNNRLKSQYGTNFPAYVYDENYDSSSGENYSLAYHIKNYLETLNSIGLNNVNARLLSVNEVSLFGCEFTGIKETSSCENVPEQFNFIRDKAYWLGEACDESTAWRIEKTGTMWCNGYTNNVQMGVRPVIEIPTSYISEQIIITFDSNGGEEATPSRVAKSYGDVIGDQYYTNYQIASITASGSYNATDMKIEEIADEESPTGMAYKISRIKTGVPFGGYFWSLRLIVGEPYYFETVVKGNRGWSIGHEQLTYSVYNLDESDGYKSITKTTNAGSNVYHAIIYYERSGEIDSYLNIASGKVVHLLPEVRREGYTFAGWYTAPDGGTRITNETVVNSSTTYYAHWTVNS